MPLLRSMRAAPLALAYWLGVAGARQRNDGRARILMFHGTPRSHAQRLAPAALRRLGGSEDIEAIIGRMKSMKLAARHELERQIRAATPGFAATREERHQFDLAGWDELCRLDPAVIAIGSHTLTHPI